MNQTNQTEDKRKCQHKPCPWGDDYIFSSLSSRNRHQNALHLHQICTKECKICFNQPNSILIFI
jgi:hypothetical protein